MRLIDRLLTNYEKEYGPIRWKVIKWFMEQPIGGTREPIDADRLSDTLITFQVWEDLTEADLADLRNELRRVVLWVEKPFDHESTEVDLWPLCKVSHEIKDNDQIFAIEVDSLISEEIRSVLLSDGDIPAGWHIELIHPSHPMFCKS